MCGDMLSSSWESEIKKYNGLKNSKLSDQGKQDAKQTIESYFKQPQNVWMQPAIRTKIQEFQDTVINQEFSTAVEEHRVEEVYWVGGEPLMFEEHWRYMKRIVDLGDASRVYARYNTNLSQINYQKINLYKDILVHLRDWQICASLDGTGATGEYIRTGLKYKQYIDNYKQGQAIQTNDRQMRIDFTLTLPGLFEVENIFNLSKELNTSLLAKVTFAFEPDTIMSPMCLPRPILERVINQLLLKLKPLASVQQQPLIDLLENLLNRQTFQEQWPDSYQDGIIRGKDTVYVIESIRDNPTTMGAILKQDAEIYEWWKSIPKLSRSS